MTAAKSLFQSSTSTREGGQAARNTALSQLNEGLQTGGIGARIPVIQRAIEASKSSTAAGLRGLDERFASSRIAGTPFAERIRAGAATEGAARTADIGPRMTMDAIAQFLPLLERADPNTIAALTALDSAAAAQATVRSSDTGALAAQKNNFYDNLAQGMMLGASYGRSG